MNLTITLKGENAGEIAGDAACAGALIFETREARPEAGTTHGQ